jgi:hypothetical protein
MIQGYLTMEEAEQESYANIMIICAMCLTIKELL